MITEQEIDHALVSRPIERALVEARAVLAQQHQSGNYICGCFGALMRNPLSVEMDAHWHSVHPESIAILRLAQANRLGLPALAEASEGSRGNGEAQTEPLAKWVGPDPEVITVPVTLVTHNPQGRDTRPVAFRRLPFRLFGDPDNSTWASDAVVALRYGNGHTVYPRSIILWFDPRDRLTDGKLVVGPRSFAHFHKADPRLAGWIRSGSNDRTGFEPTAAIENCDPNWCSDRTRS